MAVSVRFEADTANYEVGIDTLIKAVRDWETQTGVSVDNAEQKFEEAIRAVVEMGRRTEQSTDDVVRALEGIGVPADDAREAIKRIEDESRDLGREAPRDTEKVADALDDLADSADDAGKAAKTAGDDISTISDKAAPVGDGLRDVGQIAKDVLQGDFGGAVEGALGSLGEFAGLVGVGGAVGSAITEAVGGLVSGLIEAWGSYAEKVQEVKDATLRDLVDMGGALDEARIEAKVRDIAASTEEWEQALIIQQATGLGMGEVLRALAGDAEAAKIVSDEFNASFSQIGGNVDTQRLYDAKAALEGVNDALSGAPARVEAVESAIGIGTDRQEAYNEKVREGADLIRNFPDAKDVTVPLRVDDSALRNYRPPVIQVRAIVGRVGVQLQ